jgi:hypothetical protein
VEPPLLTCGLTGFTAWGFGAVELAGGVSRVRQEERFAMLALFLFDFLHHQHHTSSSRWCTTDQESKEKRGRKYTKRKQEGGIINMIGWKKKDRNKITLSNRRI